MELHFNNQYHLGDCIFSIIYFNKIIKLNSVTRIIFYCQPQYHEQLQELIEGDIVLEPWRDSGESTWINRELMYHGNIGNFNGVYGRTKNTDEIYIHFYNYLSKRNGLNITFNTREDILYDSEKYLIDINNYNLGYDVLVINSSPLSGQFPHSSNKFDDIIRKLNLRKRVITTKKVSGIDCTLDNKFTVLDIAKLSYHIKYVIAIHTAPHILMLNKFTIDRFKKWIMFDLRHNYSYSFMKHYPTLDKFMEDNII